MDICICVGSSCHLKGSFAIIQEFKRLVALEHMEEKVELKASFCTNNCINGVCVSIGEEKVTHVTPQGVEALFYEKVMPAVSDPS